MLQRKYIVCLIRINMEKKFVKLTCGENWVHYPFQFFKKLTDLF